MWRSDLFGNQKQSPFFLSLQLTYQRSCRGGHIRMNEYLIEAYWGRRSKWPCSKWLFTDKNKSRLQRKNGKAHTREPQFVQPARIYYKKTCEDKTTARLINVFNFPTCFHLPALPPTHSPLTLIPHLNRRHSLRQRCSHFSDTPNGRGSAAVRQLFLIYLRLSVHEI